MTTWTWTATFNSIVLPAIPEIGPAQVDAAGEITLTQAMSLQDGLHKQTL